MATRRSQVARAIQALSDGFVRSLTTGDTEWLLQTFYAEDAYYLAPGHEMVSGRAQIRDFLRALFDVGTVGLAIETTTIEVSGDLAYRIGRCTVGGPSPQSGKFVEVYRRQADGSWKCVGDVFNSDGGATAAGRRPAPPPG